MVTGRSREVVGPRRVLPCLGVDESKFARRRKNDDGGAREGWLNFARPAVGEWEALTRLVTSPTHRAPFLCLACRTAQQWQERVSVCRSAPKCPPIIDWTGHLPMSCHGFFIHGSCLLPLAFCQPPWAPSEISGRGKVDISTTRSFIVISNGNVGDTASHVILFLFVKVPLYF